MVRHLALKLPNEQYIVFKYDRLNNIVAIQRYATLIPPHSGVTCINGI